MAERARVQRVSTYGIARDGDCVLMVRIADLGGGDNGTWMLPGGGLDHGEAPEDAVVREFAEETGYRVTVDRLLEVGSDHRMLANGTDFHGIYVIYAVTVLGGQPRAEVAGEYRWGRLGGALGSPRPADARSLSRHSGSLALNRGAGRRR
jgi:8-oxo-dGTP diphosphatase